MRMLPLLALIGCAGWNNLPDQSNRFLDTELWDADSALPTIDGLYVALPQAGAVALVPTDGDYIRVDIGEGVVRRLVAAPDQRTLVAFLDRFRCEPDDDREARDLEVPEDCNDDDLVVTTELGIVRGGELLDDTTAFDRSFNAVEFADDGRFAVAYLDFDQALEIDGVVNLTSVVVLDLESGESTPVTVGFAADQVLFVHAAESGEATQAVVLSRNSVALLDLGRSPAAVDVTFPLTLDPDSTVDPIGVDLTPDGRFALISVRGSADLYAIDLLNHSINIVELSGNPSDMVVNEGEDRTVLVYGGGAVVDILEHDFFDLDTFVLDEPMTDILPGSDFELLYSTSDEHDVYRLELTTHALVEYRLQNPAVSLHLSPTEEFAVALTRPEGGGGTGVEGLYNDNPGMEIIDLDSDDTEPFLLEGQGLGVAWASDDSSLSALVLQEGVDYVYQFDLYQREANELELSAPPVAIGTMPDGTFFITHDRALGLVSFLDPSTGEVTEVAGFGALGIVDPIELIAGEDS